MKVVARFLKNVKKKEGSDLRKKMCDRHFHTNIVDKRNKNQYIIHQQTKQLRTTILLWCQQIHQRMDAEGCKLNNVNLICTRPFPGVV